MHTPPTISGSAIRLSNTALLTPVTSSAVSTMVAPMVTT